MTRARKLAIFAVMVLVPGGVISFVIFRVLFGWWPWGEAWSGRRFTPYCPRCGAFMVGGSCPRCAR